MPAPVFPGVVSVNGQLGLLPTRDMLAASGSYFNVSEPTTGTGVAYALKTATSATDNGLLLVRNTNPVDGGKSIYFDRLLLTETATAPTGTLKMVIECIGETGLVTLTGNVATRTPVQPNQGAGFTQTTGAVVQVFSAGAATVPAAAGTRQTIGSAVINTGVCVIHDTYGVAFGGDVLAGNSAGLTAARATHSATIVTSGPAIVVAPQCSVWLNMYWVTAAANVPSFTYNFSYFEV